MLAMLADHAPARRTIPRRRGHLDPLPALRAATRSSRISRGTRRQIRLASLAPRPTGADGSSARLSTGIAGRGDDDSRISGGAQPGSAWAGRVQFHV
jgi:hypothetical protein